MGVAADTKTSGGLVGLWLVGDQPGWLAFLLVGWEVKAISLGLLLRSTESGLGKMGRQAVANA